MKKTTKIIASLSALLCSALLVGTTDLLINPPEYETVSASTATTTSVLNDCESAKVGAIEAVGTVELSTENVVQGSHSVKVTTTKAWAPLLIYLKKDGVPLTREQLTQLDHIEITVYNANTAGMNFYFYNHNLGWAYGGGKSTTLQISGADFLAQVDGGNKGTDFDPYDYNLGYAHFQIPDAGTIYIDNVVGIFKEEDTNATNSMLNNCDVEWIRTNGSTALDATLKTEGNSSTRVTINDTNGGYVCVKLMNDGEAITTEQLLSFDYLCLDINNLGSKTCQLYLYNTLATELAPGWNKVAIPMSTIKAQIEESNLDFENSLGASNVQQFNDGWFYFALYEDCSLLFDNVRGMSEADLYDGQEEFGKSRYSAVSKNDYSFIQYGATAVNTLTSAQALAKGLPTGYSDNVIEVVNENTTGKGVLLDFSALKIPTATVESITFRVYYPDDASSNSYPSIRIHRTDESGDWVVNYAGKANAGKWFDFTLSVDGTNFNGSHNFSHLSANGYLDKFEFGIRTGNSAPIYIDSISLNLTTDVNDTDVPMISYGGEKTLYYLAQAGNAFTLQATAHDRTEGALTVQYIWSDPNAVKADGSLNVGTYTLTLKAQDSSKNESSLTLTVIAVAPETDKPVITLPVKTITLTAGTKPQLIPTITDASPVTVTKIWSNGALSHAGNLQVGTHTCTITATDLSGNSATETITVIVTANDSFDNVFEDGTQHDFSSDWQTDKNKHWKQCSCGAIDLEAEHLDANNDNKCDTCAYLLSNENENPVEPETPGGENPVEPETPGGDNPVEPETPGGENPVEPEAPGGGNEGGENSEPEEEPVNPTPEKKGCRSSISGLGVVGVALATCAIVKRKKKD